MKQQFPDIPFIVTARQWEKRPHPSKRHTFSFKKIPAELRIKWSVPSLDSEAVADICKDITGEVCEEVGYNYDWLRVIESPRGISFEEIR